MTLRGKANICNDENGSDGQVQNHICRNQQIALPFEKVQVQPEQGAGQHDPMFIVLCPPCARVSIAELLPEPNHSIPLVHIDRGRKLLRDAENRAEQNDQATKQPPRRKQAPPVAQAPLGQRWQRSRGSKSIVGTILVHRKFSLLKVTIDVTCRAPVTSTPAFDHRIRSNRPALRDACSATAWNAGLRAFSGMPAGVRTRFRF